MGQNTPGENLGRGIKAGGMPAGLGVVARCFEDCPLTMALNAIGLLKCLEAIQ